MHAEIIKQINDLPIAERIEIIEEISRSVRRDLQHRSLTDEEKKRRSEAIR